ncbi:hypothetical protein LMG28727_06933 [Paraburkholderia kirstenboschensis]|uniref:hypothetical protein n=1 Tax=Paraburkholderia kirstenboschensis TaxID=1245436 RepID=UPI000FFC3608|nr:hypothetical protein [Paraburkholderia kirstenboschensis]CAD6559690.1 hypothetical protein LMG28727_06933 [Paraburkholderia kirstenboschensis]
MKHRALKKLFAAAFIAALAGGTVACSRTASNDTTGTAGVSAPTATSDSVAPHMGVASGASQ